MREIIVDPSPQLHRVCSDIKVVDAQIRELAADMLKLIHYKAGPGSVTSNLRTMGLSAPQVGECVKLFIVDTEARSLVAINPVVFKVFGEHQWVEGCLSLPGQFYMVRRPKLIKFRYLDIHGEPHTEQAHDDYAGVFQHEIDHLSGIMISQSGSIVSKGSIFR